MASFLADTSVWSWGYDGGRDDIRERLSERVERDELATCLPVVLEFQHRARTGAEYDELYAAAFATVRWVRTGEPTLRRAVEVQRELAHAGNGYHRRPAMDFVIAATAELAGPDVVLWAFDRDMREICEHTGQPCALESSPADA